MPKPKQMRIYLTLLAFVTLLSCSKSEDTEQPLSEEPQPLQIFNRFHDTITVSVENKTHNSLSVTTKKIAPMNAVGDFIDFTAYAGDQLAIKGAVVQQKKWGRHPLFLSSVTFDTTITVNKSTSLIDYAVPASRVVQLQVQTGQQMRDQYVRGTIKYGNVEDSLFYIEPGELTTYKTIGYFNTSDVQGIDKPIVMLYFGVNKPYYVKETSVLWSKTGLDNFGRTVPLAPSITAPIERSGVYQYTAN
jgi:hypothetical protein